MTIRPVPERSDRSFRREAAFHGVALVLGAALIRLSVPDAGAAVLGRAAALLLALSLVVHGLIGALVLGRSEWRGLAPGVQEYGRVVARFGLAFIIAALAVG